MIVGVTGKSGLDIMTQEIFDMLCKQHQAWYSTHGTLMGNLVLHDTDLSNINMEFCNLAFAEFSNVKFPKRLMYVDLHNAKLNCCDISNVVVGFSNLNSIDLVKCDLHNTMLRMTDMEEIKAQDSNLLDLDLDQCTIGSDSHNYLWSNNQLSLTEYSTAVDSANRINRNLIKKCDPVPYISMRCPIYGRFIGWKKVYIRVHDVSVGCICKLEIPASARRSSALGNKCRADKAKVLEIRRLDTNEKIMKARSHFDPNFVYNVGETVSVDNFDVNRYQECAPGIHFFIDKQDALNYY